MGDIGPESHYRNAFFGPTIRGCIAYAPLHIGWAEDEWVPVGCFVRTFFQQEVASFFGADASPQRGEHVHKGM